jgi:hypothetical protein
MQVVYVNGVHLIDDGKYNGSGIHTTTLLGTIKTSYVNAEGVRQIVEEGHYFVENGHIMYVEIFACTINDIVYVMRCLFRVHTTNVNDFIQETIHDPQITIFVSDDIDDYTSKMVITDAERICMSRYDITIHTVTIKQIP